MLIERNVCPEEFQRCVEEAGGLNRYDKPNFRLIWGQTDTFRAGGFWHGNGQVPFRGYRDILIGFNDPCWILQQWQPPEKYGTPEYYYLVNNDPESGLQTLGEYPYHGRYETVLPLMWKGVVNGKLKIEHMRLSTLLMDMIIPIIKETEGLSFVRRRALMQEHKERQDQEEVSKIEARLQDAYPAFGSASRSSYRLGCNSVVQKKAEAIERYWKHAVKIISSRGKGLSMGPVSG